MEMAEEMELELVKVVSGAGAEEGVESGDTCDDTSFASLNQQAMRSFTPLFTIAVCFSVSMSSRSHFKKGMPRIN